MREPTTPRIFEAQNTHDSRRLVRAQARLYSDAKRLFYGRISLIALLSVSTMATASLWPASRLVIGGGGGLLIFSLSFVLESLEKRTRNHAAATQELFDTRIFQLEWNSLHCSRPPASVTARAADRYKGKRDINWYDDTQETVRPFDVLICQATNLGWGAAMHRLWAWILVGATGAFCSVISAGWWVFALSFEVALLTLLIPSLATLKELASLIRVNFEASNTKEAAERSLNEMWEKGMQPDAVPTEQHLRSLQDKILVLRQVNSYVPDWLDNMFHGRNEAAMRATVEDRIAQSKRYGHG